MVINRRQDGYKVTERQMREYQVGLKTAATRVSDGAHVSIDNKLPEGMHGWWCLVGCCEKAATGRKQQ